MTVAGGESGPVRGPLIPRRAIVAAIVTVTAGATAISFDPDERRLILQLAFCALGLIATATAVRALRRAAPLAPRSPLDRPLPPPRPTDAGLPIDLIRMTRRFAAAQASAADARRHLGPVVATVAADRLRRRGQTGADPESVFALLPQPVAPELTLLLDPELERVDTRARPGLDAEGASALVRALEQL